MRTEISSILTQFYAEGGGSIYAPCTIQIHFSAEPDDQGGTKYTQNLSFVITEHLKLVSGQKYFPMACRMSSM